MNGQPNGFNHERSGQKRLRDADEVENECLPISKRINSLSLNTPYAQGQVGAAGWPAAGPSAAVPPSPAAQPPLHMPLLVGGPAPAPAPVRMSSEPDLSPEECPEYFAINCYLYRLHMERLRRQQNSAQQF